MITLVSTGILPTQPGYLDEKYGPYTGAMNFRKMLEIAVAAALLAASAVATSPQPAAADIDVYITPGTHNINGRQWRTNCTPYSSTVDRCRTEIVATQVVTKGGRYVNQTGWVFNNLTYKASPRAQWANNNLGKDAEWTSKDGRKWRTECDSPTTGRNGCRSYIWATTIAAKKTSKGTTFVKTNGWTFNNMVRFKDDVYAVYSGYGPTVIRLPKGATQLYIDGRHLGQSNFIVWGLNSGNAETDLALNEIGPVEARGAIGLFDDDTVALDVQADGDWTIIVKPLSAAPTLTSAGKNGQGSEVLWYYGPARNFSLTHTGESNFIVWQWGADDSKLVANEIGNYKAQRPFLAGPSLITIEADGHWGIR
ncbi:hypothetical protein G7085_11925 [Tessaracoccus sp. HDW20]|uniref:hypothetical protein n=1 Tax=Tessaracoccus coleopterorum TaxID=2714950 RepID=UPI0018D3E15D|nr:hypothetical protein [Tessaracoccus coleopterorum]NHB85082.1 hypothetical protein [Tessaracoccus coleopterorum]